MFSGDDGGNKWLYDLFFPPRYDWTESVRLSNLPTCGGDAGRAEGGKRRALSSQWVGQQNPPSSC
ncbi:hypothetical protein DSM25559_1905 [Agrobacterium rosae]|uniref:Uncharacterized protein n=1 Tax=Agrobacterium rosae TaxID=1972867 RepID=A0A1R3TJB2_9HYPH|nr:hypothetical protein DSM25559_1905 [Agrobacterium rosae]